MEVMLIYDFLYAHIQLVNYYTTVSNYAHNN